MTVICVNKLNNIGSNKSFSPGLRRAIIGTSAEQLSIGHLGTNFYAILSNIQSFSFKEMQFKVPSAK